MAKSVKIRKLKGSDIDTETAAQQQARRLQPGADGNRSPSAARKQRAHPPATGPATGGRKSGGD